MSYWFSNKNNCCHELDIFPVDIYFLATLLRHRACCTGCPPDQENFESITTWPLKRKRDLTVSQTFLNYKKCSYYYNKKFLFKTESILKDALDVEIVRCCACSLSDSQSCHVASKRVCGLAVKM